MGSGDYRAAVADFTEVLGRDPNNIDALLNRSMAYRNLKKYEAALADLKTVAALPDAPEARIHFLASQIYSLQKDVANAKHEKELGLEAGSVSELDWIARGNCELQDDFPAAVKSFDEALQVNPESLGALRNKALALAKMPGHMDEAVAVLDKAVVLYPEAVSLRTSRGLFLREPDNEKGRQKTPRSRSASIRGRPHATRQPTSMRCAPVSIPRTPGGLLVIWRQRS